MNRHPLSFRTALCLATVVLLALVALGSPVALAQTTACSPAESARCRIDLDEKSGDGGGGGQGADSGETGSIDDSSNGVAGDGGSGGPGGDGGGQGGGGGGGGASTIADSPGQKSSSPVTKPADQPTATRSGPAPTPRQSSSSIAGDPSGTWSNEASMSGAASLGATSSAGGGGGETQGEGFDLETVQTSSKSLSQPVQSNQGGPKSRSSALQDWQIVGLLAGLLTLTLWKRPLKHRLQPVKSNVAVGRRSR